MGKQQTFYRVKCGGRNQQFIQKSKNYFTSSNIKETQNPTSIHDFFNLNGLILLHSKTEEKNYLLVKTLTSRGESSLKKSLD